MHVWHVLWGPKILSVTWIIRVMIFLKNMFFCCGSWLIRVCCSSIVYNEPHPKSFVRQHCPVFFGAVRFPQKTDVKRTLRHTRRWAIRSFVLGIGSFEFRVLLYAGAFWWQTGRVKLMFHPCWMLKPPGVLKCQGVKCEVCLKVCAFEQFFGWKSGSRVFFFAFVFSRWKLGIVTPCSHRQRAITSLTNILQASQCSQDTHWFSWTKDWWGNLMKVKPGWFVLLLFKWNCVDKLSL